jgi:alpha-amylase/alpha-mannosidase (GH57 family)
MDKPTVHLAIILHMHQPKYNLTGTVYEVEVGRDVFNQTIHPYTFPFEVLKRHENARITLNFTGSLIEQLNELATVGFDSRLENIWQKCRELKENGKVEFTGCGYHHPILPLLPEKDCEKQIDMHLQIYEETFSGKPRGFWPPELAFSPRLIPTLQKKGFKWVVVDGPHVVNANLNKKFHELIYKPHFIDYNNHRLIVIPREREISNAQQSGYNPVWLKNEVERRIKLMNGEEDMLLTVATDGENGWFRHQGENAGFWGWFFEPLLYLLKKDSEFSFIKLTTIDEYLTEHPPQDTVKVEDGSWNVPGAVDDGRFLKWTEGKDRQQTWNYILETSNLINEVENKLEQSGQIRQLEISELLKQAWTWLLMAEGSDNFWWGSPEWLNRSKICCARARKIINEIKSKLVM